MPNFNQMTELNVGLYIFGALITFMLLMGALLDKNRGRQFMKCFIGQLIFCIFMLVFECLLWAFDGSPEHSSFIMICGVLSYAFGYGMMSLYAFSIIGYIKEKRSISWKPAFSVLGFCAVFCALVFVSAFNEMFFYVDGQGVFRYTDLQWLLLAFNVFILVFELVIVFMNGKFLGVKRTLLLCSVSVFPLISIPLQSVWDTTPMYLSNVLSAIIMYMLYHGEISKMLAEREIMLAEQENELLQNRISIMLSQIQPHFLYNTLNTIYHLCDKDVKTAQSAVNSFADYLRNNINSLDCAELVSFDTELSHIKTYLDLEKIRFDDELEVVYDISVSDFELPVLSVQPIVENAVKHGTSKKRGGGSVTISTRENGEFYIITVADTGRGFDVSDYGNDGKKHIGIENVRMRLKNMCDGVLDVQSEKGKGTVATVYIPKPKKEEIAE